VLHRNPPASHISEAEERDLRRIIAGARDRS